MFLYQAAFFYLTITKSSHLQELCCMNIYLGTTWLPLAWSALSLFAGPAGASRGVSESAGSCCLVSGCLLAAPHALCVWKPHLTLFMHPTSGSTEWWLRKLASPNTVHCRWWCSNDPWKALHACQCISDLDSRSGDRADILWWDGKNLWPSLTLTIYTSACSLVLLPSGAENFSRGVAGLSGQ